MPLPFFLNMHLVVGLGNPGNEHLLNRHNIGFMLVDYCLQDFDSPPMKSEKKALTCKVKLGSDNIIFCKPQTYMNLSGQAVQALLSYYKIPQENLLVIQDDLDQAFSMLKFQKNRGSGGNNGIKDIHKMLGNQDYARMKIGVGRPNGRQNPADYLLQNFKDDELNQLRDEFFPIYKDAVFEFILKGYTKACDNFNGKIKAD